MILNVYSYSTYKALQNPSRVSCYIKRFSNKENTYLSHDSTQRTNNINKYISGKLSSDKL